jgi:hypothetical protein
MSDTAPSRDQQFIEHLLNSAPKVSAYEPSGSLLEQLIDNLLIESLGFDTKGLEAFKSSLFESFVDWNEVRLVSADRLTPFFGQGQEAEYGRKVVQALLNKIFSRGGSLDHQFLMDFEAEDLEDYLAGIMEMKESTRKRLLLRVFKKNIIPATTEHEVIFEKAGIVLAPGSEEMKELFAGLESLDLERIQIILDTILSEDGGGDDDGGFIDPEDFNSATLNKILKKVGAA